MDDRKCVLFDMKLCRLHCSISHNRCTSSENGRNHRRVLLISLTSRFQHDNFTFQKRLALNQPTFPCPRETFLVFRRPTGLRASLLSSFRFNKRCQVVKRQLRTCALCDSWRLQPGAELGRDPHQLASNFSLVLKHN